MDLSSFISDLIGPITTPVGADVIMVSIPIWIELLAVAINSVVGVIAARKLELDYLGAVFMGICTGLAGGLLRDLILNTDNVYMIVQPLAIPVAIIAGTIAFLFPPVFERSNRLVPFLDILGIGLFSALGADKALFYDCNMTTCILMGFLTAVGGGMVRDICMARVPNIFRKSNLYAFAAIGGTVTYLVLVTEGHVQKVIALVACCAVTFALRVLSIKFNITTPANVDLTPMVARPLRRVGRAIKPARTRTTSPEYASERRERVVADIDKRRAEKRRRTGLALRRPSWLRKRD